MRSFSAVIIFLLFSVACPAYSGVPSLPDDVLAETSMESLQKKKGPVYIVDGDIYKGPIDSLTPESIELKVVLDKKAARAKYGREGRRGVIEITLKEAYREVQPMFLGGDRKGFSTWLSENL